MIQKLKLQKKSTWVKAYRYILESFFIPKGKNIQKEERTRTSTKFNPLYSLRPCERPWVGVRVEDDPAPAVPPRLELEPAADPDGMPNDVQSWSRLGAALDDEEVVVVVVVVWLELLDPTP